MAKIKSKYILRTNPTPTSDGYIFETDKLTTVGNRTTISGNMVTTTNGGFTLVVNTSEDESKAYNNGEFSFSGYTLDNIGLSINDFTDIGVSESKVTVKEQKFVELRKNYDDLSKFCYFGSANARLNSSISYIINNFPAGIFFKEGANGFIISASTSNQYENKFNIELLEYNQFDRTNLSYSLRNMASSFTDYEAVTISASGETYIGDVIGFTGHTTGDTSIKFELNASTFSNDIIIRPKQNKREEFFQSLDDFESLLLNKYTNPKYLSYFKIPKESENGINFEFKSFIWPTTDYYNIDIESSSYISYLTELIETTNLMDEIYCDNLYRMMTHDTIKNLDSTYKRDIDQNEIEEIIIGGSKIEKLLRIYGRSFDEIKKYIEGISFVNTITYNGIDNLPIEYLADKQSICGWDGISLLNIIDKNINSNENLFPGVSETYSVIDVENDLMRKLIINSKYIFRSKGTKKSIRKMLGILGFDDDWYETKEYIQVVDNYISGNTVEHIARLNYNIYPENFSIADGKEEYKYSFNKELFLNTNVGIFVKCPICHSEDYIVSGSTYGDNNTAICTDHHHVFNITGNTIGYPQPLSNSTDYYFQQKGNWYRETGGKHVDVDGNTYVNEISYGNNPHIGNSQYDNGFDYIDQFSNIFKRFVRASDNRDQINISEYDRVGFPISSKKFNDNIKISYKNPAYQDRLVLNLKNFVVGINGDNVLKSFLEDNTEITTVTFSGNTPSQIYSLDNSFNGYIKVIDVTTGNTNNIIDGSLIDNNSNIKIYMNTGNTANVDFKYNSYNQQMLPGEVWNFYRSGNTWSFTQYHGQDEFNLLKAIALPYLEQLIPGSTIFDFVLIDRSTPKWQQIDDYPEMDPASGLTGYKIIAYQNINYFDTGTTSPDSSLTNLILKDYGTGHTFTLHDYQYGDETKKVIVQNEDGSFSLTAETNGFDNIYRFRAMWPEYGLNVNPIWVVDPDLI